MLFLFWTFGNPSFRLTFLLSHLCNRQWQMRTMVDGVLDLLHIIYSFCFYKYFFVVDKLIMHLAKHEIIGVFACEHGEVARKRRSNSFMVQTIHILTSSRYIFLMRTVMYWCLTTIVFESTKWIGLLSLCRSKSIIIYLRLHINKHGSLTKKLGIPSIF